MLFDNLFGDFGPPRPSLAEESIPSDSELLLEDAGAGRFSTVIRLASGAEERLPAVTPAADLIAAVETDYSDYRRAVRRLWDEHPLFEERPVVRVSEPASPRGVSRADFDSFVSEALPLPAMLERTDPASVLMLRGYLYQALQAEDDSSALFLLNTGARILQLLSIPFQAQARLRNIMEVTFDGMERASQQERYEKLCRVYPDVGKRCDPSLLPEMSEGGRLQARSILDLRLLELALYFRQEKERIARCEYCWGYYIPKTKAATRYCDRVTDRFHCKDRGARFQRNESREQDEALRIHKLLYDRMYQRYQRYRDAAPWERDRLFPMDDTRFAAWLENAAAAHADYKAGKIGSEAFLRRIDLTHELERYEAGKAELADETAWQKRVARSVRFDPAEHYPEKMMRLDLSPGGKNEWEILTADDLRRREQQGHQSLREKYGKG